MDIYTFSLTNKTQEESKLTTAILKKEINNCLLKSIFQANMG